MVVGAAPEESDVPVGVGVALVLGVTRIVMGWSLPVLVIGLYVVVTVMAFFAPAETIGIAYDIGGVTTSVITVPLVTALGVGLACTAPQAHVSRSTFA